MSAADVPYFTLNNGTKMPSVGIGSVEQLWGSMSNWLFSHRHMTQMLDGSTRWGRDGWEDGEDRFEGTSDFCFMCRHEWHDILLEWLQTHWHSPYLIIGLILVFFSNRDFAVLKAFGYGAYYPCGILLWTPLVLTTLVGNEEFVGKAIRESDVPREEIYVTTKLTYV